MKGKHTNNKDGSADGMAALSRHMEEQSVNLDEFLSEEEWRQFLQQHPSASNNEQENEYHQVYKASLGRTKFKKAFLTGTAAVFILLLILSGLHYMMNTNADTHTTIAAFSYSNNSTHPEQLLLPDKSAVILYPNSTIKYEPDYNTTHRQLQLSGKAVFTVAPKAELPFTVYCGNIATTALGTKFQINGQEINPQVHLYEGRIMVQHIQNSTTKNYPAIGETIAFNMRENKFYKILANNKQPDPIAAAPQTPAKREPLLNKEDDSNNNDTFHRPSRTYLNFSNKKLSSVFDYLAQQYHVEIHYPTELAAETNVMFSIDASQPVNRILENICQTTGMTLKQNSENFFTISK